MEPIATPQRLGSVTRTVNGTANDADRFDTAPVDAYDDEAPVRTVENDISPADGPPTLVATFDDFYRSHAGPIGQALELTLGDRELAEDALNEAMARALQRWKKVVHYDNPEGWVYRVAMNWALSWLRRRRRERDRPLKIADAELQIPDHDLERALSGLSVEHRSVVVCRFFLDWSVRRTAESLGIAEGTVKSRLARALDNIRNELEGST